MNVDEKIYFLASIENGGKNSCHSCPTLTTHRGLSGLTKTTKGTSVPNWKKLHKKKYALNSHKEQRKPLSDLVVFFP